METCHCIKFQKPSFSEQIQAVAADPVTLWEGGTFQVGSGGGMKQATASQHLL